MKPGLAVILTVGEGDAFQAAIETAAAAAALGRPVAVLFRAKSVSVLTKDRPEPRLLAELGITMQICQTTLAEQGRSMAEMPSGVTASGPLLFLADKEQWQLLLA